MTGRYGRKFSKKRRTELLLFLSPEPMKMTRLMLVSGTYCAGGRRHISDCQNAVCQHLRKSGLQIYGGVQRSDDGRARLPRRRRKRLCGQLLQRRKLFHRAARPIRPGRFCRMLIRLAEYYLENSSDAEELTRAASDLKDSMELFRMSADAEQELDIRNLEDGVYSVSGNMGKGG